MMGRTEQGKKNAAIAHDLYDKENTRSVRMKLNVKTDADILAYLETVGNKQGYIKCLIREDIARNAPKLFVTESWTGKTVAEVSTLAEGLRKIEQLEAEDKEKGTYREDFYAIVNQDRVSII